MTPVHPRPESAERGTTIAEILVVLAVSAALAVPLLAVLRTTTQVESDQADSADARIELDWALDTLARDLRTATPDAARPSGTRPQDTLTLLMVRADASTTLVHFVVGSSGLQRWEADPVTHRITRRTTIAASIRPSASEDTFVYLDAGGDVLDPDLVTPARLAECTTLVEIRFAIEVGDRDETASARHAVRTRTPGGNGC